MKLEDLYYYAEDSPSGLRWKLNRYSGNNRLMALKDNVAGSLNKGGYWVVSNGKRTNVNAHRVIWYLIYGEILNNSIIDHIDGNPRNNCLSNLRLTNQKINTRNSKMKNTNTTGISGVTKYINKNNGIETYRARCMCIHTGKELAKSFSCNKYGHEQAFQLACQWREQKIAELNEQGAGYSERHGK